jgi:hypothetical protein
VIQDCRSLNVKKVALLLLFFDVSSIGVWTQGFVLVRQAPRPAWTVILPF